MTIRVVIAGPRGKMGQEAVHTVINDDNMELVAVLDHKELAPNLAQYEQFPEQYNVPVYTELHTLFDVVQADVFVDLTTPKVGYEHTKAALFAGVRPVIGTTGFTDEQLEELVGIAKTSGVGCIIAPNFAIGAVLMMKFAQMAANYFADVEIIEMHHDRKLDAPSGTGVKTAQLISKNRVPHKQGNPEEHENLSGARGADIDGMRIHSVRLPGLVAHQQVLFGGAGELLTIRHDSFDRKSFMTGVKLSIEKVMELKELVYGLENIL